MSWATRHVEALKRGESVVFRPRGNSMAPRIRSGQECVVIPAEDQPIGMGDVVLCKVRGRHLLHKVTGVMGRASGGHVKFQISNNRGRVNGWIWDHQVFGLLVEVRP